MSEPKPIEDGGPAFARTTYVDSEGCGTPSQDGMSLRDWFAGQALAGLVQDDAKTAAPFTISAEMCYEYADAMLSARKEQR